MIFAGQQGYFLTHARSQHGRPPKARLLGAELRALREKAQLTVLDLGKLLDVAPATVSRYERGERTPTSEYVARVLGTLGVTGARYAEIVEFANTASEPNLITDGSKGLHRHLIELSEFDRAANRIVHVAPLVMPGPTQTRAYTREVMVPLPREERDLRIELRVARRKSACRVTRNRDHRCRTCSSRRTRRPTRDGPAASPSCRGQRTPEHHDSRSSPVSVFGRHSTRKRSRAQGSFATACGNHSPSRRLFTTSSSDWRSSWTLASTRRP